MGDGGEGKGASGEDASFASALEALRLVLIQAHNGRKYESADLRAAVARVAISARAHNVPPEQLLIVLKRSVEEPALVDLSDWWRKVLRDRFVSWGIDAYFE